MDIKATTGKPDLSSGTESDNEESSTPSDDFGDEKYESYKPKGKQFQSDVSDMD